MIEIRYNVLKEKVEAIYKQSIELWDLGEFDNTGTEFNTEIAPLNLVFAGQYSAGKSSLIKMLTRIESIKIGAGVTTDRVTQYQYKSLNIWDTPGIKAGECEQHDVKALEAITKADLIVYVITNELFDDILGAAFRNLCFEKGRAKDIMIVINKSENDSASKETKIDGIVQVLEPKIPEDFKIVFTDAESFFNALDEEDEQERNELLELSNRSGLSKAIDEFVAQRGLYARLAAPLSQLQSVLESKIDELDISDPLQKGLISLLNQNKRVLQANKRDLSKKITAHLEAMSSGITEQGNELADCLNSEQDEFEKTQEISNRQCEELIKRSLEEIQHTISEIQSDLEAELQTIADSPLFLKISAAIEEANNFGSKKIDETPGSFSKEDPSKLNTAVNKSIIDSAEKGFSWIAKNAIGDASKTGLGTVSGSTLHTAVKEIGGFFGVKFKPYGAIKIADKIGKGAKFLGPAMAIFGVGMQLLDDYQQAEQAQKILQTKRDIRKNFKEYASLLQKEFEGELESLLHEKFDQPVLQIDTALTDIRNQSMIKSNQTEALKNQLLSIIKLRNEIHSKY